MVKATIPVEPRLPAPPSFAEAKTRYHKVRAAGLDPNYWYIAAISRDLKRGEIREIVFWKRSIVLYRGKDGRVGAMENRCAHRQVRLSESGLVDGCDLVCQYHGWKYNRDGEVIDIWHETFGHDDPKFRVPRVPVVERYGLIWIFPGDPELADSVPLPQLPEAEPGSGWTMVPKEYNWVAHHSMVLENVSDYTHGYLHRKYQPFSKPKLVQCDEHPDRDLVEIAYQAEIGAGKLLDAFMDRDQTQSGLMRLGYQYPYNWSNTDDYIKHFVSIIPQDEQHSHFFFVLFVRSLRIPGTPLKIPRNVMR
ncbi:MAG: aromatic ring-hydroxylating dioxygenase subunit alpha, partial [Candidatus Dadabacteria bacterium]